MLKELIDFREKLDNLMCSCMDKTIVIYGYGYSGRFVAWYAEYYHSIKTTYLITEEYSNNIPYEYPLFRKSLFEFGYRDVKNAVVWVCTSKTEEIKDCLETHGYIYNKIYFDINEIVYGSDYNRNESDANVQFMKYLEKMYGYDIVEAIQVKDFTNSMEGMRPCVNLSPKEIFPILDKCHCHPQNSDAIFDFGCGKGSALFSFLEYGFTNVGGVEYADNVYDILTANFKKLCDKSNEIKVNCYHEDAAQLKEELDTYNWFYLFDPFAKDVYEKVINNVCESIKRCPRKVWIINILPMYHDVIDKTDMFVLTNQFEIMTRQRVVNVYISK